MADERKTVGSGCESVAKQDVVKYVTMHAECHISTVEYFVRHRSLPNVILDMLVPERQAVHFCIAVTHSCGYECGTASRTLTANISDMVGQLQDPHDDS